VSGPSRHDGVAPERCPSILSLVGVAAHSSVLKHDLVTASRPVALVRSRACSASTAKAVVRR
jgi:hypothetical protein